MPCHKKRESCEETVTGTRGPGAGRKMRKNGELESVSVARKFHGLNIPRFFHSHSQFIIYFFTPMGPGMAQRLAY